MYACPAESACNKSGVRYQRIRIRKDRLVVHTITQEILTLPDRVASGFLAVIIFVEGGFKTNATHAHFAIDRKCEVGRGGGKERKRRRERPEVNTTRK